MLLFFDKLIEVNSLFGSFHGEFFFIIIFEFDLLNPLDFASHLDIKVEPGIDFLPGDFLSTAFADDEIFMFQTGGMVGSVAELAQEEHFVRVGDVATDAGVDGHGKRLKPLVKLLAVNVDLCDVGVFDLKLHLLVLTQFDDVDLLDDVANIIFF
jgi:hypothetical protein